MKVCDKCRSDKGPFVDVQLVAWEKYSHRDARNGYAINYDWCLDCVSGTFSAKTAEKLKS